jgi:hypothetical protein
MATTGQAFYVPAQERCEALGQQIRWLDTVSDGIQCDQQPKKSPLKM